MESGVIADIRESDRDKYDGLFDLCHHVYERKIRRQNTNRRALSTNVRKVGYFGELPPENGATSVAGQVLTR